METSNCCDAPIVENTDLCGFCKEHSEIITYINGIRLVENLGYIKPKEASKYKKTMGIFECPMCLNHIRVPISHVKSGNTTKCKKCGNKKANPLHKRRLYRIWNGMKTRCYNKNKT